MDITLILSTNYPGEEWVLTGEDYLDLEWLSDSPKPTREDLEKLWPETQYQAEYKKVAEQRIRAYQLESDPIYMEAQRDKSRTLEEWTAKIEEIKARYPLPEKP
jgi:hypothetical protein